MEDICTRVGFNIRKIREDKAISQEHLASLDDTHLACWKINKRRKIKCET